MWRRGIESHQSVTFGPSLISQTMILINKWIFWFKNERRFLSDCGCMSGEFPITYFLLPLHTLTQTYMYKNSTITDSRLFSGTTTWGLPYFPAEWHLSSATPCYMNIYQSVILCDVITQDSYPSNNMLDWQPSDGGVRLGGQGRHEGMTQYPRTGTILF